MKSANPFRHPSAWLLLSAAALVAAPAQAWTWNSEVYSFADCDPASASPGARPGGFKSCSTENATAQAETTFTSMKASVRTSAAAPDGNYHAGNIINDSLVATAADARLAGTAGKVRVTMAFDGQTTGLTGLVFGVSTAVYHPEYNAVWLERLPLLTNFYGAYRTVDMLSLHLETSRTVDAVVSWEMPVVFGARADYQIGLSVLAYGPSVESDFSHTWTVVALDAFDAQNRSVAAAFNATSGVALPTSPVPEPQALLLMLAGLGGLGLVLRRRARA